MKHLRAIHNSIRDLVSKMQKMEAADSSVTSIHFCELQFAIPQKTAKLKINSVFITLQIKSAAIVL
jgi:hypothetical protein